MEAVEAACAECPNLRSIPPGLHLSHIGRGRGKFQAGLAFSEVRKGEYPPAAPAPGGVLVQF